MDAVIQFQDLPRVPSSRSATSGPLFCYASNDLFLDIPFPDFSYWGNMAHNQPAIWQVSATIVVSGNLAVKAVHLPAKLILGIISRFRQARQTNMLHAHYIQ